jgi:hypothetical protein
VQFSTLFRAASFLALATATHSAGPTEVPKNPAPAAEPAATTKVAPTRARRWDYPPSAPKPVWQPQLERVELPPLPAGVEDLKFNEFFKLPVGPLGLELTDRLRALDGKKVRILGFQIREQVGDCTDCAAAARKPGARPRPAWMNHIVPGRMLLSPSPININMAHYGLADDLPPQIAFIEVAEYFGQRVPFTPGLLLLTGTLSVGNKSEADGRISIVRLVLDAPPATPAVAAATPQVSSASQDTKALTNKTTN